MLSDTISWSNDLKSLVECFIHHRRATHPDSLDVILLMNLKLSLQVLVIPSRRLLVTESVDQLKVLQTLLLANALETIKHLPTNHFFWSSKRSIENKLEVVLINNIVISLIKKVEVKTNQIGY